MSQIGKQIMATGAKDMSMQRGSRKLSFQHGFTLIEMLVVIAVILLLMGLIMPALSSARQRRLIMLATSEVKQIAAATTAYFDRFHVYPPDTEVFSTGTNKEIGKADPEAIYKYLGRKIRDKNTGVEYGPFIQLKMAYLKGPNGMTYMDPWNKPYHMDCIHSTIDKSTGDVTVYGEPYPAGGSADDQANKTVEVKIWSNGPDGDESDGSNSFVGKNGTSSGGDKVNDDNICSWETN